MNKTNNEKPETKTAGTKPRSKRYDEAFKKQAVEHWLQSGKPGTQIARELGVFALDGSQPDSRGGLPMNSRVFRGSPGFLFCRVAGRLPKMPFVKKREETSASTAPP